MLAPVSQNIFLCKNGQQLGPFALGEIKTKLEGREITESDLAWIEGWTEWAPLSSVPGIICSTIPPSLPPNAPKPTESSYPNVPAEPVSLTGQGSVAYPVNNPRNDVKQASTIKDKIRKAIYILSAVFIGIVLLAVFISWLLPDVGTSDNAAQPTPTASNESQPTTTATSANNTPSQSTAVSSSGPTFLPKTVKLGHLTIEIQGIEFRNSIGSYGIATKPSPGAVFVLVRYAITNNSDETEEDWADNNFSLRDSQDRKFTPSSDAITALTDEDPTKDFILTELQPGVTKPTVTAFEIPEASSKSTLTFVMAKEGFFGGTEEIQLQ